MNERARCCEAPSRANSHRTGPRTRIDNGVTGDRARVFSGQMTAGIAVMHIPDAARDMPLQDHDVARSNRRHTRCGCRSRKTAPIGRKI